MSLETPIKGPCLIDSGTAGDSLLFLACYQPDTNGAYIGKIDNEGGISFASLSQFPCGPEALVTDAKYRESDSSIFVAVAGCGFFMLSPPFDESEWQEIWVTDAYSIALTGELLALLSYSEGVVRIVSKDQGAVREVAVPGAYRGMECDFGLCITSIHADRIFLINEKTLNVAVPEVYRPPEGHLYLNDLCVRDGSIFVADRYGNRVFSWKIDSFDQGPKVINFPSDQRPVRFVCGAGGPDFLITRGLGAELYLLLG